MKPSNFNKLLRISVAVLALACSKSPAPTGTHGATGAAGHSDVAAPTPKAPTAVASPASKAGRRAEGTGYVLEVEPPVGAPVGAPAIAQIVLRPTAGYHVNKEFPTSLELKASAGIALDKASQSPADAAKFEEDGVAFEVKFTPKAAGKAEFTAVFKFAVCTDTTCDPSRETLAWNVAIK